MYPLSQAFSKFFFVSLLHCSRILNMILSLHLISSTWSCHCMYAVCTLGPTGLLDSVSGCLVLSAYSLSFLGLGTILESSLLLYHHLSLNTSFPCSSIASYLMHFGITVHPWKAPCTVDILVGASQDNGLDSTSLSLGCTVFGSRLQLESFLLALFGAFRT